MIHDPPLANPESAAASSAAAFEALELIQGGLRDAGLDPLERHLEIRPAHVPHLGGGWLEGFGGVGGSSSDELRHHKLPSGLLDTMSFSLFLASSVDIAQ